MVAEISVGLFTMIVSELDVVFDIITYWTDAMCVLHYIKNLSLRLVLFITNRLKKIHEHSKPDQWWYLPNGKNSADIGSRGLTPEKWHNAQAWLCDSAIAESDMFGLMRYLVTTWCPILNLGQHGLQTYILCAN